MPRNPDWSLGWNISAGVIFLCGILALWVSHPVMETRPIKMPQHWESDQALPQWPSLDHYGDVLQAAVQQAYLRGYRDGRAKKNDENTKH